MKIRSSIRDYDVHFAEDDGFVAGFSRFPQVCFVVDENVWAHHSDSTLRLLPRDETIVLPVSEERKTLATVLEIYDRLTERSAKRNLTLVTIGGGTLQDVTGFAASTLYRGINWIFVPTTLLAQADSCIGSKTSLNYRRFKNLIGTFYPPSEVHIHPSFLKTLREEDFFSGLGEVVKLHLMGGEGKIGELSALLPAIRRREPSPLHSVVRNSLLIKQAYIEGDEFDTGRRNLLNFGHCFGHALETVSGYEIPHGQAVLIGIVFANIVSRRRGLLPESTFRRLLEDTLLPNLLRPPSPGSFEVDGIYSAMKQDKKRTGEDLAMVLLRDDLTLTKVNDYIRDELVSDLDGLSRILSSG
jgi:3-dehydroquinate synthase